MNAGSYSKLMISLLLSFVIMYVVMFLNITELDHVYLSLTRTYMCLLMTCPMALIMLGTMHHMYTNKRNNQIIVLTSVSVFAIAVTMLRTQGLIGDTQYLKAMIPHHSSAIMTSDHANLKDAEVRALSRHIVASQRREIEQMKRILNRMNGKHEQQSLVNNHKLNPH